MNTFKYITKKYKIDVDNQRVVETLDIDRNDMAKLFAELKFRKGAEIGVDRGLYSEVLCKANPRAKLYSIDPWKVYRKYEDIVTERMFTSRFNSAQRLLKLYSNCEIIRKSSTGALKDFAPNSLDFVFIDGNHRFDYVLEDLNGWSKVVRKGGIVSGHDYGGLRRGTRTPRGRLPLDVDKAVNLYVKEHNIKKLFLLKNNRDNSYFFVNE